MSACAGSIDNSGENTAFVGGFEEYKTMIKVLFVCWGTTLTDAGNLDDSKIFSDDISYLQLLYNI